MTNAVNVASLGSAMVADSSNNVLVGSSSSYAGKTQSWGAVTANTASPNFSAIDTTSVASGVGGELGFFGQYTSGGYAYTGSIRGIKENGTDGNTACALTFYTRPTATAPSERMRVDSSGNLLLGTTSKLNAGTLSVLSSSSTDYQISVNDTRAYSTQPSANIVFGGKYNAAGTTYKIFGYVGAQKENTTDGNNAGFLAFGTTPNGGSETERARISSVGGFMVGTTTDPGAGLISDVSGNVRSLPINSQTGAYVATASDNGKVISITTGGVTINNSVFSAGMVLTIYNNSGSNQTITQGTGVTLQWAGQSSSTTGNRTLGLYGMATVLFLSASSAVITGSGLT